MQRGLEDGLRVQAGPGIIRTLSLAPPYFLAKSGVNTLNGGTVPFLMSGVSRLAISVQCVSEVLISSWLPCSFSSGHWLPQK